MLVRILPRAAFPLIFVASSTTAARAFHSHRTLQLAPLNVRGGAASLLARKNSTVASSTTLATTTQEAMSPETAVAPARCTSSSAPSEKLSALRAKMAEYDLDAYLVPSDDPHLSEYVPDCYKRRAFLSNFNGSAGTALITRGSGKVEDKAYLWTDSRYFNEASRNLDFDSWALMKQGQPKVPTISKFLSELAVAKFMNVGSALRLGIDPYVHPASFAKEMRDAFTFASKDLDPTDVAVVLEATAVNIADFKDETTEGESSPPTIGVIDTLDGQPNLVDSIWSDRPPQPKNPFRVQPFKYAGMTIKDKLSKIRSEMKERKATLAVFGALDDVAYLFNVRSKGDIETCPVGIAYATVSLEGATLYCDEEKVRPEEVCAVLHEAGVIVKSYGDIVADIAAHCSASKNNKIWLDKTRSNYAIGRAIPAGSLVDAQNAVSPMKACKNESEMEGMRRAHVVDGVAMAHFMAWLENRIVVEGKTVSEVEIDAVLTGYRAEQPGFHEVSFPTIAGVGSNGAIVHYQAAEGSELLQYLDMTKSVLIDSGGQYEYGTTDVTRTWHFGEASDEFKDLYTRVLKGNIGIDAMIFPENTPGFVFDVLARQYLWEVGKDYGHGTGHGVGAGLNVHEGPHGISPRWTNREVLKKGMVTSNEPGYYEDGNFGIRIENLLEIVDVNREKSSNTEDGPNKKAKIQTKKFLKFEKLTMIPIQTNLIVISLMTVAELDWLDAYHQEILEKVAPLLEEGSPAMSWLRKSCEKINR